MRCLRLYGRRKTSTRARGTGVLPILIAYVAPTGVTVVLYQLTLKASLQFQARYKRVARVEDVDVVAVTCVGVIKGIEIHCPPRRHLPSDHTRVSKADYAGAINVGAALGGLGWKAIACQAITRFIGAPCSSSSMLVASLRPHGGFGIDDSCNAGQALAYGQDRGFLRDS